ncbi:MAG: 50S ribosomal protein L6 [Phycisphaerae bacterium]|jgi:large subunit ribosomal protein L6
MSRVGEKPVAIPGGVTVKVSGRQVEVSGPKGRLTWTHPVTADVAYDDASKSVRVKRKDGSKQSRANHGLTRALLANMVEGVSEGFERRLQIYGTGYNCKLQGRTLQLNVGFSGRKERSGAQFDLTVPDGVEVVVERDQARGDTDPAQLVVKGIDKQKVGQFAAEIRAVRKTEPYKGKGIRYEGEQVRRKQGKALTGAG